MQLCSHYLILLLWYVGVHLDCGHRVAAGAGVCELVALLSSSRIVLCCVIGLVVIPSSRRRRMSDQNAQNGYRYAHDGSCNFDGAKIDNRYGII